MADAGKRAELIVLVDRILRAEAAGEERSRLMDVFEQEVLNPEASNLIDFPYHCGLGRNPSAEEIVDAALSFRPFLL
jgi:hypothetical protein